MIDEKFSPETRSHLKNGILVQDQGGGEFQPAVILKYFEDLKRGPNAEVGPKDIFEIASNPLMKNPTCPAHLFQSITGYATEPFGFELSTERLVSHEKSRLALCEDLIQAGAVARSTPIGSVLSKRLNNNDMEAVSESQIMFVSKASSRSESGAYTLVCEHFGSVCNAAHGH